jgi:hypothetical protein
MENIQFKIINQDMVPSILDFMEEHYYHDEPICRSLGINRNWMSDELFKETMKDGSSIAALDKGGNIIGVRLGIRIKKPTWMSKMMDKMPNFVYPDWFSTFMKLTSLVGYDVSKMFDQLGSDLIYDDTAVCTARATGVRGLGTELCRRTEILAKDLGCTHTYACVTGN